MKHLLIALPLLIALLAGCSVDSPVGPDSPERILEQAEECNPNMQLC